MTTTGSLVELLPFLESLPPRLQDTPGVEWSSDEMWPRVMHLWNLDQNERLGAGFVYRTEGDTAYIVTVASIVYLLESEKVAVVTGDGARMTGSVFRDGGPLTLVRACCGEFETLSLSDKGDLKFDDEVTALGYAYGPENPASYIRATVKDVFSEDGYSYAEADSPLSLTLWGPAGEPLFDDQGLVVGIVTRGYGSDERIILASSIKENNAQAGGSSEGPNT